MAVGLGRHSRELASATLRVPQWIAFTSRASSGKPAFPWNRKGPASGIRTTGGPTDILVPPRNDRCRGGLGAQQAADGKLFRVDLLLRHVAEHLRALKGKAACQGGISCGQNSSGRTLCSFYILSPSQILRGVLALTQMDLDLSEVET